MSEGFIGSDPQSMQELSNALKSAKEQIDNAVKQLDGKVKGVQWKGQDASKFKDHDWPDQSKQLHQISQQLETTRTVVDKQRQQQIDTSQN